MIYKLIVIKFQLRCSDLEIFPIKITTDAGTTNEFVVTLVSQRTDSISLTCSVQNLDEGDQRIIYKVIHLSIYYYLLEKIK